MKDFMFYAVIVLLKMMAMSLMTARVRITKGVSILRSIAVSFQIATFSLQGCQYSIKSKCFRSSGILLKLQFALIIIIGV